MFAFAVWDVGSTSSEQNEINSEEFDPTAAPKEAIQRAWRTKDNSVFLQYAYTGPNACWQNGNTASLSVTEDVATFTIVPTIVDAFCAQALTALIYDQEIDIPQKVKVLIVVVAPRRRSN